MRPHSGLVGLIWRDFKFPPNLGRHGQIWPSRQSLAEFADSSGCRPNSARSWPLSAKLGPSLARLGGFSQSWAVDPSWWACLDVTGFMYFKRFAKLVQLRVSGADAGAKFCAASALDSRPLPGDPPQIGLLRTTSLDRRSKMILAPPPRKRPKVGRRRAKIARSLAVSGLMLVELHRTRGQMWSKSGARFWHTSGSADPWGQVRPIPEHVLSQLADVAKCWSISGQVRSMSVIGLTWVMPKQIRPNSGQIRASFGVLRGQIGRWAGQTLVALIPLTAHQMPGGGSC